MHMIPVRAAVAALVASGLFVKGIPPEKKEEPKKEKKTTARIQAKNHKENERFVKYIENKEKEKQANINKLRTQYSLQHRLREKYLREDMEKTLAAGPTVVSGADGYSDDWKIGASIPADPFQADDENMALASIDTAVISASTVDAWAARLDAYLAGSPMAGTGDIMARAALEYGVDPRLCAAISTVESGKGTACFEPYNAWGWGINAGGMGWTSWEEAIRGHTKGLANGYGGRLTPEGAQRYCPTPWRYWYNRVCEEMHRINTVS